MKNKILYIILIILIIPVIVSATPEKYEANLPRNADDVKGDDKRQIYTYNDSIYKYNIKTNSYEKIIDIEKYIYTTYVRDNYIYMWHEGKDDIREISCYNLTTHKLEFNYSINVKHGNLLNPDLFIANSKQEVILMSQDDYKIENGEKILNVYQFDKTGKQIGIGSYKESKGKEAVSFITITPDDEFILQYSIRNGGYISGSMHHLKNGNVAGGSFNIIGNYKFQTWSFISNDIAIGEDGQIARFTKKTITDSTTKEEQTILNSKTLNNSYSGNYYYRPTFYNDTNSVFVSNGQGGIIEYDKTNFKRIGYLNVEDNAMIMSIDKDDKYFYILYSLEDNKEKAYVKKIPISDLKAQKQITIDKHTASNHTLNQIKNKYQASKSIFDYSKSIYKEEPIFNAPYYEGILKDEVINDTLNQLNFYRWLSGMNTLELNKDKMARSQKGAFIQDLNNDLTHYTYQPDGMSTEFYNEAQKGIGASAKKGDTYSGNVSYNTRIDKNPLGYIDDSNNVSYGVGHRSSMLDPYAYAVSFGQSGRYNATSIYYDNTNNNPDEYYSYPTPGYFPYNGLTASAYWSIWISNKYQPTPNTTVTLTHKNKKYIIDSSKLYYDSSNRTTYYKIPDELKKLITKNNQYVKNETVNVSINNLEERYTATYATINYNTTFVELEEMKYLQGDLNNNGKIDLPDVLIELKIYFNDIKPTSYQSKVGDMNNKDGINLTDILMILKIYFAKS